MYSALGFLRISYPSAAFQHLVFGGSLYPSFPPMSPKRGANSFHGILAKQNERILKSNS